jgi:hypothetical protein
LLLLLLLPPPLPMLLLLLLLLLLYLPCAVSVIGLVAVQFNSIQFNFIQNPFDPDTGCNVQAIGYRLSHVSNVCSNY